MTTLNDIIKSQFAEFDARFVKTTDTYPQIPKSVSYVKEQNPEKFHAFLAQAMRAAVEAHWEAVEVPYTGRWETKWHDGYTTAVGLYRDRHASFLNERPDTSSGENLPCGSCTLVTTRFKLCVPRCPCPCHKAASQSGGMFNCSKCGGTIIVNGEVQETHQCSASTSSDQA